MGLLKKLSKKLKNKELPENVYYQDLLHYHSTINEINSINEKILLLKNLRRKDQENSRRIAYHRIEVSLEVIKEEYKFFCNKITSLKLEKRLTYDKTKLNEEIIFLEQKKKELRKEFESIYRNFRNVATGLRYKDIPMNNILAEMRRSFKFEEPISNKILDICY